MRIKNKNKPSDGKYAGKTVLLIDGGSRQVLPMIKGFSRQGCEVSVYCSSKLDVGYVYKYTDKKVMGVFDPHDTEGTYSGIRAAIERGGYDLVVPMNDYAATLLARHREELSRFAYIAVNSPEIFDLAADKQKTMQICMDNDIPCPKTAVFSDISEFSDEGWSYPLVIKPRSGYGANGFNTVENREELNRLFVLTEQKFGESLVQEYIPQTSSQYQVEMVMGRDGECKSFVLMDKLRWYPINGGSSTINVTLKDEKIKNDCVRLLKALGWVGYASLDLIRDPRDGVAKILEINPRINGTAKICFKCGVDLALQLLEEAAGGEITEIADYQSGVYLRYVHMDVMWFLKSKNRFSAKPSFFSFKNTVDEIFSWEDLKPFFVYSITAVKKLISDKKKRSLEK